MVALSAYFDDELTASKHCELSLHVKNCPICGEALNLLAAQRRRLCISALESDADDGALPRFWRYVGRSRLRIQRRIRQLTVPIPLALAILAALIISIAMNFIPITRVSFPSIAQVERLSPPQTVVSLSLTPNDVENLLSLMEDRLEYSRDTIYTLPTELPVTRFGEPQILRTINPERTP